LTKKRDFSEKPDPKTFSMDSKGGKETAGKKEKPSSRGKRKEKLNVIAS